MCIGIIESKSLKTVVLDGNPVGVQGAKAIMLIPVTAGDRVHVSCKECNVEHKDAECWFDLAHPIGSFQLHLQRPYDRAVAFALLHLAATHKAMTLTGVSHQPTTGAPAEPVALVHGLLPVRKDEEKEKQHIPLVAFATLKAAAQARAQAHSSSSKSNLAQALFPSSIDADPAAAAVAAAAAATVASPADLFSTIEEVISRITEPGCAAELFAAVDRRCRDGINDHELLEALTIAGFNYTMKQCRQYMAQFDIDGSGLIEVGELSALLHNFADELGAQLRELSGHLIMACPAPPGAARDELSPIPLSADPSLPPPSVSQLPLAGGGVGGSGVVVVRYIPPASGVLRMALVDSLLTKTCFKVCPDLASYVAPTSLSI